jgi:hypothetical protein
VLLAPDTRLAVLFESKVLSDVPGGVEFDVLRNQIARNIDVMLEPNPRLMCPLNSAPVNADRRVQRGAWPFAGPEPPFHGVGRDLVPVLGCHDDLRLR